MLFTSNFLSNTFPTLPFDSSIRYAEASDIVTGGRGDGGDDDSSENDGDNDSSPPGGRDAEDEDDALVAREEDEDPPDEEGREEGNPPLNGGDREDDQLSEDASAVEREGFSENIEGMDMETICLEFSQRNEKVVNEEGTLTIKKISVNTGEQVPGTLFRITPNPYTLDNSLIVSDNKDIDNLDCSPRKGVIVLEDIPFSGYNIQEIRQPIASSNDGVVVLHEVDMYIHENLANPVINFVERHSNYIVTPTGDTNGNGNLGIIPDQYIITLNDDIEEHDIESIAQEFANKGGQILQIYDASLFKGFAINIERNREELLREIENDSRAAFIEQDKMGQIASSNNDDVISAQNKGYETIPRGIDRIDADLKNILSFNDDDDNQSDSRNLDIKKTSEGNNSSSEQDDRLNIQQVSGMNATGVDIAILDTGVSLIHPDLNVYQDVSFVNYTESAEDDQGHGSHIAGTVAGMDNSLGIIGTAPGARLWALKVCDSLGNCPVSSQIKGVEYITEHSDEIDVANISIENPLSPTLDRTINQSIIEGGVTYVVAAGNSGKNASLYSPASNPSVITVSAINDSDGKCGGIGRPTLIGHDDFFANFSNFGPAIDIAAPGVDIFSTYNGTEYAVYTGTSTAAPHVTGAAALYKATHPLASPSEVYDVLMTSASLSSTKCDGEGHGYFQGDIDGFEEPLLYVGNSN
jgi:hypothetical protein